jgi:hypothetical protein
MEPVLRRWPSASAVPAIRVRVAITEPTVGSPSSCTEDSRAIPGSRPPPRDARSSGGYLAATKALPSWYRSAAAGPTPEREIVDCRGELACGLLAAIKDGGESDFINSLLDRTGYAYSYPKNCSPFVEQSASCGVDRHGPKFWLSMQIYTADPYHHGAPKEDTFPMIWRYVTIHVSPNP